MEDNLRKYKGLIELIKTTEDVVVLDEEMDMLLQSLYHVDLIKFEDTLSKFIRVRVATEIKKILQAGAIVKNEEVKRVLSDAYRTICALPILRLTLAFEPSEAVINGFSYWSRNNLKPGILLDLSLDRNLVGGAVIAYEGKFYDYSLRNKVKQIFEMDNFVI